MQCYIPPPLTEDQITTVLDGVADRDVQQHLAQCPECAARVVAARRVERTLKTALNRWDCPTAQQLGDYHQGLLNRDDAAAISHHLKQCVRCTAELEELRIFLLPHPSSPVPPQPARHPLRTQPGPWIARILPRTPALGLRGAATGPIVAEADGMTLVLDTQPTAEGQVLVRGQLEAVDQSQWIGALIEFRQAGRMLVLASVDDLGTFQSQPLPPGLMTIRITPAQGPAVELREIDL